MLQLVVRNGWSSFNGKWYGYENALKKNGYGQRW